MVPRPRADRDPVGIFRRVRRTGARHCLCARPGVGQPAVRPRRPLRAPYRRMRRHARRARRRAGIRPGARREPRRERRRGARVTHRDRPRRRIRSRLCRTGDAPAHRGRRSVDALCRRGRSRRAAAAGQGGGRQKQQRIGAAARAGGSTTATGDARTEVGDADGCAAWSFCVLRSPFGVHVLRSAFYVRRSRSTFSFAARQFEVLQNGERRTENGNENGEPERRTPNVEPRTGTPNGERRTKNDTTIRNFTLCDNASSSPHSSSVFSSVSRLFRCLVTTTSSRGKSGAMRRRTT